MIRGTSFSLFGKHLGKFAVCVSDMLFIVELDNKTGKTFIDNATEPAEVQAVTWVKSLGKGNDPVRQLDEEEIFYEKTALLFSTNLQIFPFFSKTSSLFFLVLELYSRGLRKFSVRRYFDLHFKRHASEVVQDPEFACLGPSWEQ